jgi:hypothetical protein
MEVNAIIVNNRKYAKAFRMTHIIRGRRRECYKQVSNFLGRTTGAGGTSAAVAARIKASTIMEGFPEILHRNSEYEY